MSVDLSVVLGSLNRKRLIRETINSVRANGFEGSMEIIVIDGGSADGTCAWLARQRDVLTVVQPNYALSAPDGTRRRAHTWGEFINLGFHLARAPWVLMISDDVVLCPGAIARGLSQLGTLQKRGERVGGGALFWREYPRDASYHVKMLPGGVVHVNHGFFNRQALEAVGFADERDFEFYGADGDLSMRLNLAGWKTVALEGAFAEHLNHRVHLLRLRSSHPSAGTCRDMATFDGKYGHLPHDVSAQRAEWRDPARSARRFWRADPYGCLQGIAVRYVQRARG